MATMTLIEQIKSNDEKAFLTRIEESCKMTHVLWDAQEDSSSDSIMNLLMILVKKGVSFTWLLFNRGLIWHRDNNICPN